MEWLIIVGLAIAVMLLWERVGRLERRFESLEADGPPFEPARAAEPELAPAGPAPEAALAAGSAPAVPESPPPAASREPDDAWLALAAGEPAVSEEAVDPDGGPSDRSRFDFEDMFGRRLPIWAGGIALAVAGVFLVRYSIEAGLLTPRVRVALSFLFGLALLAGAEAAYRLEDRIRDPRVRQALAGAGLATLYAAFYLAGTHYGLIGAGAAFLGLAAVTGGAIALSFRFGLPSAVLGLVGGFAAPALVASDEGNVPLLTLYLALITAGLAFTGHRQGRPWLGYAALAGGFLWGLALLSTGPLDTGDLLAFGLFLTAMGAFLPMLAGAVPGSQWVRLGAAALASLQLAALIELAGFQPLTWGLYLLLAAALAALSWREPRLREAGAFAAALGLWLLAMWGAPSAAGFALVGAGFGAVFVLVPLAFLFLGRGRPLDLRQLALAAPMLAAVTYGQFGRWDTAGAEPVLATVAAVLSLAPAAAAWREWRLAEQSSLLALPIASSAALAFAALLMLVPAWAAPLAAAGVALGLALLARVRSNARAHVSALDNLAWGGALVALATLAVTPVALAEIGLLAGIAGDTAWVRALPRWLAAGVPFLALATIEPRAAARMAAESLAALLAYGAAAQVVPAEWLAWTAALGAIAACLALADRRGGWGALVAVAALWSLAPLGEWMAGSAGALAGLPLLLADVPGWRETLRQLLPSAAALAVAGWRLRGEPAVARGALMGGGIVAFVALHSLYKHVFALGSLDAFVGLGMAERTVWQALLAAGGLLALRLAPGAWRRPVAAALFAMASAHFTWFTLLVHDPLWSAQAVGPLPLLNWLLPAYALAGMAVVLLARQVGESREWPRWLAQAALMVLVSLLAISELRHAFSGSLLTAAPMTQGEDLLRSLLGILLAIGFLAWGSRTGARSWRIGSLVLMLLAVGKVFLVDAAGLEGLLRVASFMALGFSLIGIGWVYARQLAVRRPPAEAA